MDKKITLSITDRILICRYVNLVTCTVPIRLAIDGFIDAISPTREELKKSGVQTSEGKIVRIDDDFTKDFESSVVPECIRNGIVDFCESMEANKNAPKDYVDMVTTPLKKVL